MKNPCDITSYHLARLRGGKHRESINDHLRHCENCRRAVNRARQLDQSLAQLFSQLTVPEVNQTKAEQLVEFAQLNQRQTQVHNPTLKWVYALGTVLILLVAGLLWFSETDSSITQKKTKTNPLFAPQLKIVLAEGGYVDTAPARSAAILAVPGRGRLLVEAAEDQYRLTDHSRAEVQRVGLTHAAIQLIQGKLHVTAASRAGSKGKLEVFAGGFVVRVRGTAFSVTLLSSASIRVSVEAGEVAVANNWGKVVPLTAGETQFFGLPTKSRTESPDQQDLPTTAIPPDRFKNLPPQSSNNGATAADKFDREAVRSLILAGKYQQARKLLYRHLYKNPNDTDSRSLLGDCYRKEQKWRLAVTTYREVAGHRQGAQANRARYKAAVLAQDRLGQQQPAIDLLREYLQQPPAIKPLAAQAMFRLAKLYIRSGEMSSAKALLNKIVDQHAGTAVAISARKKLEEITLSHPSKTDTANEK